MRYYRYGKDESNHELAVSERKTRELTGQFGELIIDEDTIYEIDKECIRCQKNREKTGQNS